MLRQACGLARMGARRSGRWFSTSRGPVPGEPSVQPADVFDYAVKKAQRDRAAVAHPDGEYDYLHNEISRRLVDRLNDITSAKRFPLAVDIGSLAGDVRKALDETETASARGIETIRQFEISEKLLRRDEGKGHPKGVEVTYESVDPEGPSNSLMNLPVESNSVDVVFSSMALHWINDLPGMFKEVNRILKPDGVFLAAMLGGETLQELRSSFAVAEQDLYGGVSPHISPFVRDSEIGGLITGAGMNLPTVDSDLVTIRYPDLFTLCEHLRGMGESNATNIRNPYTNIETFLAAAAAYEELYADEKGILDATFHVIYLIGWKKHESQQMPDERGSATSRLSATLEALRDGPLSAPTPPGTTPTGEEPSR